MAIITAEMVHSLFKASLKSENESSNEYVAREMGITVEELRNIYTYPATNSKDVAQEIANYVNSK